VEPVRGPGRSRVHGQGLGPLLASCELETWYRWEEGWNRCRSGMWGLARGSHVRVPAARGQRGDLPRLAAMIHSGHGLPVGGLGMCLVSRFREVSEVADVRRLPRAVADVWDWQLRGLCRGMDSAVFFHPERERGNARTLRETKAKAICRRCPVLRECREHALSVREPYGIWGAMTAHERAVELAHRKTHAA